MKRFLLPIVAGLMVSSSYARTGVHEALRSPGAVMELYLTGEANEAALLAKNAKLFTKLNSVVIAGMNDSIAVEQNLVAVAACPGVHKVRLERCGVRFLSGALRMLVSVNTVAIDQCAVLDASQSFAVLSGMPALKTLTVRSPQLKELPRTFKGLRTLDAVCFINDDLTLADGYALNTQAPEDFFATDSLRLGFGSASLLLSYSCYDKAFARAHISLMRDLLQGVAFSENELQLPQRPAAFRHQHPLVKPPVPGMDVASNVYVTNTATGGSIEHPSGTKIFIPAHAFVDANGNELTGNVSISYREFRDPVDILLSGIPMKYDSAGQAGDFESAGMFEMYASVNGKEAFLAPGKKIDMDFAVVDTASTFNFYRLDEQKGWQYVQQTGKVESKPALAPGKSTSTDVIATTAAPKTTTVTPAVTKFSQLHWIDWKKEPLKVDTVLFDQRYADTNYFYMTKSPYADDEEVDMRVKWKTSTRWRLYRVRSQKGTACFDLSHTAKYTPSQMSHYRSTTWLFNDSIGKTEFQELRSSRSGINDVRLVYNGGSSYTMELKFPDGFRRYSVTAVKMEGKKPVPVSEQKCAEMDRLYTRDLTRRQLRTDRKIAGYKYARAKWDVKLHKDSLEAWGKVKGLMNEKERAMDFNVWSNYLRRTGGFRFYDVSDAVSAQSDVVYQELAVMGFGVYNCDQIRRIENPVEVFAFATDPDGLQLNNVMKMFVLVPGRNQAFGYTGEKGKPLHVAFGKDEQNKLLAIEEDGTVWFCDTEQFNQQTTDENENTRFHTTLLSEKPLTGQQLKALIYPEVIAQK